MAGVLSLRTVVHILACIQYYFTLHYMVTKFRMPQTDEFRMFHTYGGHYKFLTNWNLICQTLLFTICLINDLIGTNEVNPKQKPLIRKLRDTFHCSIGFPMAVFVGLTFWALYGLDRELVFPKAVDPYFPVWLNHVMHTNIVVFTLVEHVSAFRVYPSRKKGLTILSVFMVAYLIWTLIIYGVAGRWVYPVMEVLNWPFRILFIVTLLALTHALYFLGEKINNVAWSKELRLVAKSPRDKKSK